MVFQVVDVVLMSVLQSKGSRFTNL